LRLAARQSQRRQYVRKLRLAEATVAAIKDSALATWRFGNNVINLRKKRQKPNELF
jgi:hypothetical protein